MATIARHVSPDTTVPTCPQWSLHELVAHQGGVHRWATAHISGDTNIGTAPMFVAPHGPAALADWLLAGANGVVDALRSAPDDLDTVRFLRDAPPARAFWARRQAHEITIHAVDAQAAAKGRTIASTESGIGHALAVDGLDELISGFVPRDSTRLRHDSPLRIAVVPTDSERGYTVDVSPDTPVTRSVAATDADLTVTGTALQLYLGLWNRGDEFAVTGRTELLEAWRRTMRIRWS